MSRNVRSCAVRNGTGNACCVNIFALGSGEAPKEQMVKPDDELACSFDASKASHLTVWYQSDPRPSTHVFPAGANSAVVDLSPSLTSAASAGAARTDGKQKLTFVNQCSVDIWYRLFFKEDYKDRLVFAGGSETEEFEEVHVTSFGAKFQYPAKNGVSDFRWIPVYEASIHGSEVNITFKPTIAVKMSPTSSTGEAFNCAVRNGTGNACCVNIFALGSGEAPKEQMVKPDDELACSFDASKASHLTVWYQSDPRPSTHVFPAGANSAVVDLSPSLTSAASAGAARTDGKQKLTFVNQCSVDIWYRLFFKEDYKDRLVFAGGSETEEFEEVHVTSFGAKFQYPAKNGVSDFRWIPAHEASIHGSEVNITFKPTIALKTSEAKPAAGRETMVQDLFRKYDPGYCTSNLSPAFHVQACMPCISYSHQSYLCVYYSIPSASRPILGSKHRPVYPARAEKEGSRIEHTHTTSCC